jgi:hypothetical protein
MGSRCHNTEHVACTSPSCGKATQVFEGVVEFGSFFYIIHPLLLLECRSETFKRTRWPPIVMKLSTSHSYQTLRSSVCRQKLTSTSELAGNCMGIWTCVSIIREKAQRLDSP